VTGGAPAPTTDDRLLGGRVLFRQPATGYRAAIDPVLLAASVPGPPSLGARLRPGARVVDLGAGAGAASLCLLARAGDVRVVGVEIDPAMAALARFNAAANGWSDRMEVVEADVEGLRLDGGFDCVIANPPFHDATDPSPDPAKRRATALADLTPWIATASRLLGAGGHLAIILRADRIVEVLLALAPKFGSVELAPIWPRLGEPAKRVIVHAVKGGRAPASIRPGLALHDADGYTAQARTILTDGAAFDL
jgi:tRNA1(Val) A37 N6-methylase TrmN6